MSLALFSWCLDVKASNSSHTAGSLNVPFMERCSAEDDTGVTNLPAVEVLVELTICFVDASVDDPDLVGLVVEVSPLAAKRTIVCGWILDLDRVLRLSFPGLLASLAMGVNIAIPQVVRGLIDQELPSTVILVVLHCKTSLPRPDWLAILTTKPVVWLWGPHHFIAFIVFRGMSNDSIFDE